MSGRVVCPDEYVRYPGQIGESEFLSTLSLLLQDRLTSILGADAFRQIHVPSVIQEVREILVGEDPFWHPLDPWLGQALGCPPGTSTPQDYYDAILGALDLQTLQTFTRAVEQAAMLPAGEISPLMEAEEHPEPDAGDVSAAAGTLGTGAIAPPPPAGAVPPSSKEGQWVHWVIQVHYVLSHPGHRIILDNRLGRVGADGVAQTMLLANAVRTGTDTELTRAFMGLMSRPERQGITRWPDILDVDLAEVYEIKPRNGRAKGRRQLNEYLLALNQAAPPIVSSRQYRAGSTWSPWRIYPVPPDKFAITFQPEDGLIIYDLVRARPPSIPVGELLLGTALALSAAAALAWLLPAAVAAAAAGVGVGAAVVEMKVLAALAAALWTISE
ncbi:hypothetical protein ACFC0D_19005 [Streptomyces sp. NPDC056222]|uniref:hypothetical protein n=1 Tax=Streptomyces sp. NPDC056222 TaxID=3345749 RepID=UPI0035E128C0